MCPLHITYNLYHHIITYNLIYAAYGIAISIFDQKFKNIVEPKKSCQNRAKAKVRIQQTYTLLKTIENK